MAMVKMNADVDEGLAKRMQEALENTPGVPQKVHGRLTWVKRQLEERYGHEVRVESVRRWMLGLSMPTTDSLDVLSKFFGVDSAWLAFGTVPATSRRQAERLTNAATGAVSLAVGFLQATGVSATLETVGNADILAIIHGQRQYFQVGLLDRTASKVDFRGPYPSGDLLVVEIEGATAKLWILDREHVVDSAIDRPGAFSVELEQVRGQLRTKAGVVLRPAVDLTLG